MTTFSIDTENSLYYEYYSARTDSAPTLVFINPLTGDFGAWNNIMVPALQAAGFGTLVYNFRGQASSEWSADLALNDDLIISDLRRLLDEVHVSKPVLVGLSIGGLYAARAMLAGQDVAGLVLINTLRKITPRLAWMNESSLRVMSIGGPNLMKDLFFNLLVGEPYQQAHRSEFLSETPDYAPLPTDSGTFNLMTHMGTSDWDIDWHKLDVPTLVITGTQDRVFYDAAIVDELFDTLPNARRIDMHNAGHMLPVEVPEQLSEALLEFAKSI